MDLQIQTSTDGVFKELTIAIAKAMMTSGHKNATTQEIQIRVEDMLELCASIPSNWLMRCFKHARAHHGNVPSPVMVNKSWDTLKADWREANKRATLPDRSHSYKQHHECPICPVVAVRCANYYKMPCDFIELNNWQKEWLKTAPRKEEIECFNEKVYDFENPYFMKESYKPIYGA